MEDGLSKEKKKILVPVHLGYGRSVAAIGDITDDCKSFFKNPKKFDMILFTGGEDVDPKLYGDKSPHKMCSFFTERDAFEVSIFDIALKYSIPMVGICRGLQLFNVMAGGKLMHHIKGHGGSVHKIDVIDGEKQNTFKVNSMHHQMIIPKDDVIITGWSTENLSSGVYYGANDERVKYDSVEVEAAIFPELKAFGVQYHPECMEKETAGFIYFESMAKDILNSTWEEFMILHSPTVPGKQYKATTT